jgi:hypothetical protein
MGTQCRINDQSTGGIVGLNSLANSIIYAASGIKRDFIPFVMGIKVQFVTFFEKLDKKGLPIFRKPITVRSTV